MLTSFILSYAQVLVASPVPGNTVNLKFFGLFLLAVGLLSLFRPQIFWHLRVGRKIPGVPPSKLYLLILRFGAVLVIILGLAMVFELLI